MTTDDTAPDSAAEVPDPEATDRAASRSASPKRKHLPVWQESILLLAVALGLAIVIKAVFMQAFYIPSESMEPGLVKNDRILVQKVSYWFGRSPQRGDVVVFKDPGEWLGAADSQGPTGFASLLSKVGLYPTGGHLVKRVIGTEGDVVECCDEQGRIKVNGKAIDESDYLNAREGASCNAEIGAWRGLGEDDKRTPCSWTIGPIPKGKMLVLGDNREHSADSRAHLCVPDEDPCTQSPWVDSDLVVGKVFTLIWPRDRWRWISRPEAFDGVPDDPPADLLKKAEEVGAVPGT
ncbi:signal peptidase I [Nocardioides sp. L-11A]|uniref:signal peptidase I n=1 Tax=Nocardioides sp. L-11A TaxID=3043848 RepID=UPI00249B9DB1|nr:signal peptidase I [Nocardioides sp. L-11A]